MTDEARHMRVRGLNQHCVDSHQERASKSLVLAPGAPVLVEKGGGEQQDSPSQRGGLGKMFHQHHCAPQVVPHSGFCCSSGHTFPDQDSLFILYMFVSLRPGS